MSSIPSAPTYGQILVHPLSAQNATTRERTSQRVLHRQPTVSQGQALEKLGRAIEYVYDSRVYQHATELSSSDLEAVQILMRLSREVFMQCREVAPSHAGLKLWLARLLPDRRAA
jgi:hypothetical protein